MNEKKQITYFLSKFKIGDYVCNLRCNDEHKWINIDGYNNNAIFSTLGISDPDSFVEKFYTPCDNLCYWPPMDIDGDIENMLKLVFELYLRYEFKQLHIGEHLMEIGICGIKLCVEKLDSLCEYCTSHNRIWPKIKHHILTNQDFPQVTFGKYGLSESNCSDKSELQAKLQVNAASINSSVALNILNSWITDEKDSKDDSDAIPYKGHTQITINKGKKKFKIPTKI